jgi:hypothetical protein
MDPKRYNSFPIGYVRRSYLLLYWTVDSFDLGWRHIWIRYPIDMRYPIGMRHPICVFFFISVWSKTFHSYMINTIRWGRSLYLRLHYSFLLEGSSFSNIWYLITEIIVTSIRLEYLVLSDNRFVLWIDLSFLYWYNEIVYYGLDPDILLLEEWYTEDDFRVIERGDEERDGFLWYEFFG